MVKWRVNILCLLGSLIGIMAIFLPWASGSSGSEVFYYDLIFTAGWNPALVILFIIGTGLSFITSLGAFVQLTSFFANQDINSYTLYGPIFAIISFVIIVLSILLPITLPLLKKPYSLRMRLLTFSKIKDEVQPYNPA
jgi:magnesium-transporting ATPase (P-type)